MQISVNLLVFSVHTGRFLHPAEVCEEMHYQSYISVTAGYRVSPHPLQSDLHLGAQM